MLCFLGINSGIDYKTKLINIKLVIIFGVCGLIWNMGYRQITIGSLVCGAGIGMGMLAVSKITRDSLGFGDGLILIVTGIYLGFWKNIEMLLAGLIFSAIVSIYLLVFKKVQKKKKIPFIPFLFLAYICMLCTELYG